jgi:hypothetical protein
MKFKFSWNMIFQGVAMAAQLMNQVGGILPAEWKEGAVLVIGAAQAVVAAIAHFRNPDGTPAALPYVK